MYRFIRFAAGVLTGVAAMALIKNKQTKAGLEKAEDKLRDAAVSTLRTVEKASAKTRERLASKEEDSGGKSEARKPEGPARKHAGTAEQHEKSEN